MIEKELPKVWKGENQMDRLEAMSVIITLAERQHLGGITPPARNSERNAPRFKGGLAGLSAAASSS
jgi:hypothetical protein